MSESGEQVDIKLCCSEYVETLSDEEQLVIRQSHFHRAKKGKEIWNTWSENVLAEIEKTYPENVSDEDKEYIRSQYKIDFSNFQFHSDLDLSNFKFFILASFESCYFFSESKFVGAEFRGGVSFNNSEFNEEAQFEEAEFHGYTSFCDITFNNYAYFIDTKFLCDEESSFAKIICEKEVYFYDAKFHSPYFIYKVFFKKSALFNNAKFYKGFMLEASRIEGEIDFSNCTFDDITRFERNSFKSQVNFSDAEFKKSVKFTECDFSGFPCDVRQTIFKQIPLIDNFSSDLKKFISMDKSNINIHRLFYECESMFRVLKQLAEKNNNHQKALEFYGCELYCQSKATGGISSIKNWANCFYGFFSGYGLSLWLPFVLWLMMLLGSIVLQGISDNKMSELLPSTNLERVAYYAAPSIPIFIGRPLYQKEVRHRLYDNCDDKGKCTLTGQLPTGNRIIRLLQTLLSYIALFLFGLALRNRFKIG